MDSVLSIGNFDGLHIGHRRLLEVLKHEAESHCTEPRVITFANHPAQFLQPQGRFSILTPSIRKQQMLYEMGFKHIEMLKFDDAMANTSADEFLHEYLIPCFHPKVIVVGYDSHFGHDRQGNLEFLHSHSDLYGYQVRFVEPVVLEGQKVSSSLIRNLLAKGEIATANTLLTKPYTLFGNVIGGESLGVTLGMPTANLGLEEPQQLIPKCGVYLSEVVLEGECLFGLTNIGVSPTLKHSGKIEIETHILDFNNDIYGADMSIRLIKYLREEMVFDTRDELKQAMQADLTRARLLISGEII